MKATLSDTNLIQHLLRRAGFGYTQDELEFFQNLGYEPSVDYLLNPESKHNESLDEVIKAQNFDFTNIDHLKLWWLMRMAFSKNPLEEKMTLFWHGHFATSNAKVNNAYLMYLQNRTLRQYSLLHFKDLLQAVVYDPAMIEYLDNQYNYKGKPNENFSRELMELFTLGIGNYTETDVKEGARAFTGYHTRNLAFYFDAKAHDFGEKNYLGHKGDFNGNDIVEILANETNCAEYISLKLCRFFVSPSPNMTIVKDVTKAYKNNNGNIKMMLYTLFNHPVFKSGVSYRQLIKSPVDYTVSSIKSLEKKELDSNYPKYLASMGQDLFYPPSVKGWDGGKTWIATDTFIARYNFASHIVQSKMDNMAKNFIASKTLVDKFNLSTSFDLVKYLCLLFIDNDVNETMQNSFYNYLSGTDDKNGDFKLDQLSNLELDAKIRGLTQLILTSPMYNVA